MYGPLYFLPQPLNMVQTAALRPHCAAAKDPSSQSQLYQETVGELGRLLGGPLPNALPAGGTSGGSGGGGSW